MKYRIKVLTTRAGVRYVPQNRRYFLWCTLFAAMYTERNILTEERARELINIHYTQWLNTKCTAKPFYIPVSPVAIIKLT